MVDFDLAVCGRLMIVISGIDSFGIAVGAISMGRVKAIIARKAIWQTSSATDATTSPATKFDGSR